MFTGTSMRLSGTIFLMCYVKLLVSIGGNADIYTKRMVHVGVDPGCVSGSRSVICVIDWITEYHGKSLQFGQSCAGDIML
jgi:hypothetical protein